MTVQVLWVLRWYRWLLLLVNLVGANNAAAHVHVIALLDVVSSQATRLLAHDGGIVEIMTVLPVLT